ncbi:MAG: hypothetical protein AAFX06_19320 [Planctomycetota bacterium]
MSAIGPSNPERKGVPSQACADCQAELQAWQAAELAVDDAETAAQAALQAYMDCEFENGGGSGTPPLLKDSGESILVE